MIYKYSLELYCLRLIMWINASHLLAGTSYLNTLKVSGLIQIPNENTNFIVNAYKLCEVQTVYKAEVEMGCDDYVHLSQPL